MFETRLTDGVEQDTLVVPDHRLIAFHDKAGRPLWRQIAHDGPEGGFAGFELFSGPEAAGVVDVDHKAGLKADSGEYLLAPRRFLVLEMKPALPRQKKRAQTGAGSGEDGR